MHFYYRCLASDGSVTQNQTSFTLTPSNGRFFTTRTLTIPDGTAYINLGIGSTGAENYWIKPKLEKGNVATDWTPAPEDMDARVSSAETKIDQTAHALTLTASKTEVDAVEGRMTQAEASIGLMADEIALKVERDGIISAINFSPEAIKMSADRIEFDGHVFGTNATFDGRIRAGREESYVDIAKGKIEVSAATIFNPGGNDSGLTAVMESGELRFGMWSSGMYYLDATYSRNKIKSLNPHDLN